MPKTPKIYKEGKHHKPTQAELDAEMQKQLEELEKIENEGDPQEETLEEVVEPTTEEEEIVQESTEEDVETTDVLEEENGQEQEENEPTPAQEPKVPQQKQEKEVDYQKRYRDSSSEAHILYSKNKKIADAIKRAGEVTEPTEEELKIKYPSWDVMDDDQREMAKDNLMNKRRLDAIQQASKEFEDIDQWNAKVDEFLTDPGTIADNPQLEGKEEDFKVFVTSKQSRMGVDFEDLIAAFLFAESQKVVPKKKGSMFPTSSAGENSKPQQKDNKISIADANILRRTNYKKYVEYLKAGKIRMNVDEI